VNPSPESPAERAALRQIKKYANRKFYDTEDKRYISLAGIASLVRAGEDICVTDQETGEDITGLVLSQILRDLERRGGFLPQALLTALVRRGSGGLKQLRGSFQASLKALEVLEDEILERVDAMAERGDLTLSEAQELREELVARGRERQANAEQKILHEIEESLLRLGVPSRSDVESLHTQLDQMGAKLDSLLSDSPSGD
jgi:polyhydroxyalkanoate synthesis repressor PhaR